jgi:hypothetical protein
MGNVGHDALNDSSMACVTTTRGQGDSRASERGCDGDEEKGGVGTSEVHVIREETVEAIDKER